MEKAMAASRVLRAVLVLAALLANSGVQHGAAAAEGVPGITEYADAQHLENPADDAVAARLVEETMDGALLPTFSRAVGK
jgi:hypothetical protein